MIIDQKYQNSQSFIDVIKVFEKYNPEKLGTIDPSSTTSLSRKTQCLFVGGNP